MLRFEKVERYDAGTNEQYHDGDGVSNSQISDFIENPALYHGRYNTLEIERRKATADMLVGTALHELCLEGGLQSSIAVEEGQSVLTASEHEKLAGKLSVSTRIPDHVLNDKGHCRGADYTSWAANFKGRTLLKSQEYDELESKVLNSLVVPEGMEITSAETMDMLGEMVDALRAHESANELLFGEGESEVPIRGLHVGTGIGTRCKLDRFSATARGGFCADLKTVRSASPKDFASSVDRFGYHRQRVLYGSLVNTLVGREVPFYFVCIEKTKPYRVEVYELVAEWVDKGIAELEKAFRDLNRCAVSNEWKHGHYGDVLSLPMPRYINYQNEWEAS